MPHVTATTRLDSLVAAACATYADAPALLGEDAAFTYRELGSAADSEASRLTAAGLQPGMTAIVPVSNQAGDIAALIGGGARVVSWSPCTAPPRRPSLRR